MVQVRTIRNVAEEVGEKQKFEVGVFFLLGGILGRREENRQRKEL